MEKPRRKSHCGLTLIEVMVAIFVMMIVVLGAGLYRYSSTLDVRKASKNETASRIASLLNEGWRGVIGDFTYDPVTELSVSGFSIQTSASAPQKPDDFTLRGSYKVISDGADYYITMSYKFDQDNNNAAHKRIILNTIVAWPIGNSDSSYSADNYKLFSLTTYVEKLY